MPLRHVPRETALCRFKMAARGPAPLRGAGGGAAVVEALLFPRRRPSPPRAVSAAPLPIKVTMATVASAGLGAAPRCGGGRARPGSARPGPPHLAWPLLCGLPLWVSRRGSAGSFFSPAGLSPISGLPRQDQASPPHLGTRPARVGGEGRAAGPGLCRAGDGAVCLVPGGRGTGEFVLTRREGPDPGKPSQAAQGG